MVQLKKKVTIKTKTAQEETPVAVTEPVVTTPDPAPNPSPEPSRGGSKMPKVIGGIAAAACIAGAAWFFSTRDSSNNQAEEGSQPTELVSKQGTGNDAQTSEDTNPQGQGNEDVENNSNDTQYADGSNPSSSSPETGESTNGSSENSSANSSSTNSSGTATTTNVKQNVAASTNSQTDKSAKDAGPAVSSSEVTLSGTIEEKAKQVIRGDFGNGQVRKDKLGASYAEIQSKVNEMYRNGLVR